MMISVDGLAPDPSGKLANGGLNLHGYVGNDPITHVDPIGLGPFDPLDPEDVTDIFVAAPTVITFIASQAAGG